MSRLYTYRFFDLRTLTPLAELPLSGVTFSRVLNGAGAFQAKLDLGDTRLAKADPLGSTIPQRTALYIDRAGVLVWGGIVWTRKRTRETQVIDLAGSETWSYFQGRYLRANKSYAAQDPLAIARDLITWAQAQPGGDINVAVGSEASGTTMSINYLASDDGLIADLVLSLSEGNSGSSFDFYVGQEYSAGVPQPTLRLGSPHLGTTYPASKLVLDSPVALETQEDGAKWFSAMLGQMNNDGSDSQSSVYRINTNLLDAGWPLLEGSVSLDGNLGLTGLSQATVAALNAARPGALLAAVQVPGGQLPVIGSYSLGDYARLISPPDSVFPSGLDEVHRVVGWEVTPSAAEQFELVSLVLDGAV